MLINSSINKPIWPHNQHRHHYFLPLVCLLSQATLANHPYTSAGLYLPIPTASPVFLLTLLLPPTQAQRPTSHDPSPPPPLPDSDPIDGITLAYCVIIVPVSLLVLGTGLGAALNMPHPTCCCYVTPFSDQASFSNGRRAWQFLQIRKLHLLFGGG